MPKMKLLTIEELKEKEYNTIGGAERISGLHRDRIIPWLVTGEVEGYQLKEGGWWRVDTKSLLKKIENLKFETRARAI